MKLLFGGLPIYHQRLIRAVLKFYNIESEFLPEPDYEAFLIGRKYCSRGFCNPAYFTIGNLIKFLLEKKKKQEDISQYIYVTVGACPNKTSKIKLIPLSCIFLLLLLKKIKKEGGEKNFSPPSKFVITFFYDNIQIYSLKLNTR